MAATNSPNMYTDLIAAQQEFPTIRKDNTANVPTKSGGSFKYTYADLADILDAVRPVLHKHNFALVQATDVENGDMLVITRLHHTSGESVVGRYPVRCANPSNPQDVGGALTYARRYALMALLGLAAEDDDAQTASRPAPSQERRQPVNLAERVQQPRTETGITSAATDKQKGFMAALMDDLGWSDEQRVDWLMEHYGVRSRTQLSKDQATQIIDTLKKQMDAKIGQSEMDMDASIDRAAKYLN